MKRHLGFVCFILSVSLLTSLAFGQPEPRGIPYSYLDTNTSLTANSDTKVSTQKAVKAYVDTKASGTSTIVDDTSTAATMYPTWVTANTGNLPLKVSSSKLSFTPSTGVLSVYGGVGFAANNASVSYGGTYCGIYFTANMAIYTGSALSMYITSTHNVLLGGATAAGTSAVGVLGIASGTAPTTAPANMVQIYSEDVSPDNCVFSVMQEMAPYAGVGVASTHKIPVRWNGATYYMLATTIP